MDAQNNIISATSPSQPSRSPLVSRERGWSLSRNRGRRNITNPPSTNPSDTTSYCNGMQKDTEGNIIMLDSEEISIIYEPAERDRIDKNPMDKDEEVLEASDINNGNETQDSNHNGFRSQSFRNTVSTISRSVSFGCRDKEYLKDLWNDQPSRNTSFSATEDSLPWDSSRPQSALGTVSSDTLTPGRNSGLHEAPAIILNKMELGQSSEGFSSTERIKRRSAEISELRLALEEKVKSHYHQSQHLNGNYRNSWSNLLQSPKSPQWPHSRPKSACGFTHLEDHFENEHLSPIDLEHNRNNMNMKRWNNFRDHDGIPALHGPSKHKASHHYSARGQTLLPYNPKKDILCQRCSSPVRNKSQGSFWSLGREGDDPPSSYHTPSGSPAHRLPQQCHQESTKPNSANTPVRMADGRINYYPNCDAAIWVRSCTHEVTEPLSGLHIGDVPKWLRGALIRNGPGRIQVGEHQYNHVFDGSALLHRFHFKDGRVTYQNKFLQSRSYLSDTRAQRIVVNYFGTRAHPDPCKTILQNIASKFTLEEYFTDNAQISLYPYGDSLYALTETPFMYRVDPDTLNTHEKVDLTRHISIFTHTAHPHVDRDGTVYNLGQGAGPLGPRYHICKFPKSKTTSSGKVRNPFEQARVVGTVAARWLLNPCYMHSFAMTDNYWVIIEQPLVVSVPKMLRVVVQQDALIDALQWWEKETKIHVVRRDTGRVTTTQYVTDTFFFLHTINAYEDSGHIVLDIAAYKNAEMLHCMFVEALKNASYDPTYAQMFRGRPKRWILPLEPDRNADQHTNLVKLPDTGCRARWIKKGVVYLIPELLANIGCEVPRIHYEAHNGRHYQYFYAICSDVDHPKPGTLVKVDVVNKQHVEWGEDNVYPSEPIFVPSPYAKREDEGVVLSALLRARGLDREVCLVVLDAASFTEVARVEFLSPGPVPKCLHGWFVPEGTLTVHQEGKAAPQDVTEGNHSS